MLKTLAFNHYTASSSTANICSASLRAATDIALRAILHIFAEPLGIIFLTLTKILVLLYKILYLKFKGLLMDAVNYSDLRQNLKKYLDYVYNDHEPLIVTRKNNENVVILSVDDFNALNETQYLVSTKNNAEHLQNSLNQLRSGKGFTKELIEE